MTDTILTNDFEDLKGQNFDILYVDPPWDYYGDPDKMGAAGKHYGLMSYDSLADIPIHEIHASPAALFLWATGPKLHNAVDLLRAWGFHYRGVAFVWAKTTKDGRLMGPAGVPPTCVKPVTEFVLLGTTNKQGRPFPLLSSTIRQVVQEPRGRHSEKPAVVRDLIVQAYGAERKRIELFSRHATSGWSAWGDEVPIVTPT